MPEDIQHLITRAHRLFTEHIREVSAEELCPQPRVSILMGAYNHAAYVMHAVDSVLAQEVPFEYEIIITDDASTDGTTELILACQKAHPDKIRLLLASRNLWSSIPGLTALTPMSALQAIRGDYVCFLDADDYWSSPHKLANQVSLLDADSTLEMAVSRAAIVLADGTLRGFTDSLGEIARRVSLSDLLQLRLLFGQHYFPSSTLLFRRRVIDELPPWVWSIIQRDYAIVALCASYGDIHYNPLPSAAYRIHDAGSWSAGTIVKPSLELRQHRRDLSLQFLRLLRKHFHPQYSALLNDLISTDLYKQANDLRKLQRHVEMRAALKEALATKWLPSGIPALAALRLQLSAHLPTRSPSGNK